MRAVPPTLELWQDKAIVAFILEMLLEPGGQDISNSEPKWQYVKQFVEPNRLAEWLTFQGIGLLSYSSLHGKYPELAQSLKIEAFMSIAQSQLHLAGLQRIKQAFSQAHIQFVLLKGAALAQTVYEKPELRTMSDVDIWLAREDMPTAVAVMRDLGYQLHDKDRRPLALEKMAKGELQFSLPGQQQSLVELHWSAFSGWWLNRTAAVNDQAIWKRAEPLGKTQFAYQLAPEDMIINLAVHLSVLNQFSLHTIRALIDMALLMRVCPILWPEVIERAKEWRVATAVWTTLNLLQQLVGPPGLEPALAALRPSLLRRWLLRQIISPEAILAGQNLHFRAARYPLLLLLVDRPRDMARLMFRTLWPEKEWLAARYGHQTGRWAHLWRMARHREI